MATCSGQPQMSGNVLKMSVNSFDSGCASIARSGYTSDVKLGYSGPTKVFTGTPSAARACRSCRHSNSMTSSGHVGAMLRGNVRYGTTALGHCCRRCWVAAAEEAAGWGPHVSADYGLARTRHPCARRRAPVSAVEAAVARRLDCHASSRAYGL
jgi:hypothetical protein